MFNREVAKKHFLLGLSTKGTHIFLFLCMLNISAIFFTIQPTYAYTLEGPKWPHQPAPGQCCAQLNIEIYNGTYISNADKQGWINGYGVWNLSAAKVNLSSVSSSPLWVYEKADGTVGYDGITYLYYNSSGFTSTQSYVNYAYTQNYNAATIQGVAAHEIGHAMGLDHTNGCVLMTPYTSTRQSCGITKPVQDDVNGINALY